MLLATVIALELVAAVIVLQSIAPVLFRALSEAGLLSADVDRAVGASITALGIGLAAACWLSMRCIGDIWRFHAARENGRGSRRFFPRAAELPSSKAVEDAVWAVATPRPKALEEVTGPLSPILGVSTGTPISPKAHSSLLHAEDGARCKWCDACDAWVRVPSAHCTKCVRCVRLADHHSAVLRVCIGADNRRNYCMLLTRALLLQLGYAALAAAFLLLAADALPLRRAAVAALEGMPEALFALVLLASSAVSQPAPLSPPPRLLPCASTGLLVAVAVPGSVLLLHGLLRQLLFVSLVLGGGSSGSGGSSASRHERDGRSDWRQRLLSSCGASRWASQRSDFLRIGTCSTCVPSARDAEKESLLQ